MASVHRKPRSPYWMAKFRDHTGKVVMRSTKRRVKSEALQLALSWEQAGRAAREGELTRAAAMEILNGMVQAATGERLTDPTIREFCEEWLKAKEGKTTPGTLARYKPSVRRFLESLGQRADRTLRGVTASDVERYQRAAVCRRTRRSVRRC